MVEKGIKAELLPAKISDYYHRHGQQEDNHNEDFHPHYRCIDHGTLRFNKPQKEVGITKRY